MQRDLFTTAVLGLIAVAILVGTWHAYEGNREFAPGGSDAKVVDINSVADRVLDFRTVGEGPDASVEFTYAGGAVPAKLATDEVPELRRENSYTRYLSTVQEGKDPIVKVNTIFYSRNVFVQRPDGWHYIERGKTSLKEFNLALNRNPPPSLIAVAHADTQNFTPVNQEYTGYAGDGYTSGMDPTSWANVHALTASALCLGSGVDYTSTTMSAVSEVTTCIKTSEFVIGRAFIPFDTRILPWNATISAATLNVYVSSVTDGINDSVSYLTVVQSSQASSTQLVSEDYDQDGAVTSPTEGIATGQRKDLTSISTSAYLAFTLNATGQGWIKRQGDSANCGTAAGVSCFGIREGHDTTNTAVSSGISGVSMNTADAGQSTGPYLSVTYTTPASELLRGLRLASGNIKVYGGTLRITPK